MRTPVLPYRGPAGWPRRGVRVPLIALAVYLSAYVGMRAAGRIRPFFNQGSFDVDYDDRGAIVFLPLMRAEQEWHNRFSPPPAGG